MVLPDNPFEETDLDRVLRLRNGLVGRATGGSFDGGDPEYKELRQLFGARADTRAKLPGFVRKCTDLSQFWGFIKYERKTYAERRDLLWEAFTPLIEYMEAQDRAPGVAPIGETLEAFDSGNVHAAWQKALDRRQSDPDGAITAARMLLETVCKHILDDAGTPYPDTADLPKLWTMAAEETNLAPNQNQEAVFKTILGSCQQVVNSLGTLRNKVGDAHGQGRRPVKPKPRHAELAVNLAGAMAAFLVATWDEQHGSQARTQSRLGSS